MRQVNNIMKTGTIFQIGDESICNNMALPIKFAHKLAVVKNNNHDPCFDIIEPVKSIHDTNHWFYILNIDPSPNIVLDPK